MQINTEKNLMGKLLTKPLNVDEFYTTEREREKKINEHITLRCATRVCSDEVVFQHYRRRCLVFDSSVLARFLYRVLPFCY